MTVEAKDLNPANYASHEEAEDLTDRGDVIDSTATRVDDKPAKKVVKKTTKKTVVEEEEEEEEEEAGEEEEEEAGEEEEEEAGEEEEEDDKPDDTKGKRVPYKRFARQRDARLAAELRAEKAEAALREKEDTQSGTALQKAKELTDKLAGLYDQVEDARAEGKTKEAAKLQREIDEIRDGMTRSQAAHFAAKAAVEESNVRVFNALVKELEVADPRFSKNSEDHDPDLVEEVAELTEAYEAKGMPAPEALRKAVKTVLREDPFGKAPKALKKVETRKTDVVKNLKTAKSQPAEEPGTVRERGGKIDASKLSEAEFDALPESKKKQLRGDEVDA